MKFHYYPETDSLYIELTERTSVDSQEASPGVVLDYDTDGVLVGIDIDNASSITDVTGLKDANSGGVLPPSMSAGPEKNVGVSNLASRLLRAIFGRTMAR